MYIFELIGIKVDKFEKISLFIWREKLWYGLVFFL